MREFNFCDWGTSLNDKAPYRVYSPSKFRKRFENAWQTWLKPLLNGISITCFVFLGAIAVIIFSPLIIIGSLLYLFITISYWLRDLSAWVKNSSVIPLLCTLLGLLFGLCGGAQKVAIAVVGAGFGFAFGLIIEVIRQDEVAPSSSSWFESLGNNNNGGFAFSPKVSAKKPVEKPWSWKGFEVHQGPKEDDIRKDLC